MSAISKEKWPILILSVVFSVFTIFCLIQHLQGNLAVIVLLAGPTLCLATG